MNESIPGRLDGYRDGIALSNELLAPGVGEPLVQFRVGYALHLELGSDFEVTIETPFTVSDDGTSWTGEPLTAAAAGALLPLRQREVTFIRVDHGGTLNLGFGEASLSVPPHPM